VESGDLTPFSLSKVRFGRPSILGSLSMLAAPFLTSGAGSPISPTYDAIHDEDRFISAPPPYPLGHGEGSRVIVVVPLDQAPRRSFPELSRGVPDLIVTGLIVIGPVVLFDRGRD
jgi:hypothetical protein